MQPAGSACARRLPGPKILDLGGGLPVQGLALARLARAAVAVATGTYITFIDANVRAVAKALAP